MKITDITITPLSIGKSLLRIQTDAGVEGLSEVSGRNGGVFDAYLQHRIKLVLVGEDPRSIERHWTTLADTRCLPRSSRVDDLRSREC